VDRDAVEAWVARYERAWRTAGTEPLAELFAPEATYSAKPFSRPHRGLDAIARFWERNRAGPEEAFTMESELVAVEGRTAVVRTEVVYERPPRHYRNLWIVELDETGRAAAFEEWYWPAPKRRR
jgi:uncharacterized protein (TIGR02246 family)